MRRLESLEDLNYEKLVLMLVSHAELQDEKLNDLYYICDILTTELIKVKAVNEILLNADLNK